MQVIHYINDSVDCESNQYGVNCEQTCSFHCAPPVGDQRKCGSVDGSCLYGCREGNMFDWGIGDRCDIILRNKDNNL